MATQEEKDRVLETLKKKAGKTKFYLKDFNKIFPEKKPREVKKIINEMVTEGLLEYWSSGSTTLIGLKGAGVQHEAEKEE
jgi:hypothetical protein